MRPYLAIIKDSFREALASRVLWVLLILTTVVLAALSPVGVAEHTGTNFTPNDITDPKGFVDKIKHQQAEPQPSPGRQVWTLFTDDYKAELTSGDSKSGRARWPGAVYLRLSGELNEILTSRKLYDRAAWSETSLPDGAQKLLKHGIDHLDDDDVPRLNRMLLEAAYPKEIAASREKSVAVTYLWSKPLTLPMSKKAFADGAIYVLQWVFCGVVGVFAGVLVTASIIPQTYAAGAIDLLLSKPIARSLLFLTKYAGGCIFILLNGAYAIGGLWLIAGLRWGIWNSRILLIIPVLTFLFAVYFAVSSLAGVIWRNAIVSVVIAMLFWAICLGVGFTKEQVLEPWVMNPRRLIRLVSTDDDLISVNERGEVFRWSDEKQGWARILTPNRPAGEPPTPQFTLPLIGPVYDAQHDRLLALPVAMPQFGLMLADNSLIVGDKDKHGEWKRHEGVAATPGTAALLMRRDGTLLAVTPHGLTKLAGEAEDTDQPIKVFGFTMPTVGGGRFVRAGVDMQLGTPLAAAIDHETDDVVLFDAQTLRVLSPDAKGRYVERVSREIEGGLSGIVAIGGGRALLARADGEIRIFGADKLEPQAEFHPEGSIAPRFAACSPDGKAFLVLFHNHRLWLFGISDGRPLGVSLVGQGDISAAAFATKNRLLVADRLTRVTEYDISSGKVVDSRRPSPSALEAIYFYGIRPLHAIFPKPGEIDNVVNYLLTGTESVAIASTNNDLQTIHEHRDIWGPIWSNLAFIAVVVGLGCLYTHRKDF